MVFSCFIRESLIAPKSKVVSKGQAGIGRWGWASKVEGAGLLWFEELLVPVKAMMSKQILGENIPPNFQ